MRYTDHHLRSAPIAIAAMLALGSTSGLAQTAPASPASTAPADPIVLQLPVVPQAEPAPTPAEAAAATPATGPTQAPTIVLDLPTSPAAQAQAEPTEEAPRGATVATRTSTAEAEPAQQRSEPAPAAGASVPIVSSATGNPDAPVSLAVDGQFPAGESAAALPLAAGAPEAATSEPSPVGGPDWVALIALAFAGLIPLSLAFLAFAWFRRRSRRAGQLEMDAAAPAPEPEPVARESVEDDTIEPVSAPAPIRSHPLDSYRGLPNGGAAVALPAELPRTFEERDALLRRMIAAEPDRANPFRSTRARAKRARLILQSLGRRFENAKPRIDLSEYTSNWPALARRRTAYA